MTSPYVWECPDCGATVYGTGTHPRPGGGVCWTRSEKADQLAALDPRPAVDVEHANMDAVPDPEE